MNLTRHHIPRCIAIESQLCTIEDILLHIRRRPGFARLDSRATPFALRSRSMVMQSVTKSLSELRDIACEDLEAKLRELLEYSLRRCQ